MKEETISNKEIIEFYSEKYEENEEKCKNTFYFEKNNRQDKGGYIEVAETFKNNGNIQNEKDKEYIDFYNYLIEKKENNTLYDLKAFKNIRKEFDIFLENSKINQKWHCLVSWYAWLEWKQKLNEKKYENTVETADATCIFNKRNTCPELRLWLVEAAAQNGKYITQDDVEKFKDEAVNYSNDRKNNKKNWNKLWEGYVSKILKEIKKA